MSATKQSGCSVQSTSLREIDEEGIRGALSCRVQGSLVAKMDALMADVPAKERDFLWGELFAEPRSSMLAPDSVRLPET